jgi:hypothetical protein
MPDRVTVVSRRTMRVPPARARAAVWDIQNIERTEVKADAVTVTKVSPTAGSYTVRGHFAGVPWRGEFFYELNPSGFHSRNAPRPGKGSTIEGGFTVEAVSDDACTVVHYEQYRLPWYFRPLRLGIVAYLRTSMRRELRDLEQLVGDGSDRSNRSTVSAAAS